jgi:hypothetical protein
MAKKTTTSSSSTQTNAKTTTAKTIPVEVTVINLTDALEPEPAAETQSTWKEIPAMPGQAALTQDDLEPDTTAEPEADQVDVPMPETDQFDVLEPEITGHAPGIPEPEDEPADIPESAEFSLDDTQPLAAEDLAGDEDEPNTAAPTKPTTETTPLVPYEEDQPMDIHCLATSVFWRAAFARALWTLLQTLLGVVGADYIDGLTGLEAIDWRFCVVAAASAAGISLAKSIMAGLTTGSICSGEELKTKAD